MHGTVVPRQNTFWKHLHPKVLIYLSGSLATSTKEPQYPHSRTIYFLLALPEDLRDLG